MIKLAKHDRSHARPTATPQVCQRTVSTQELVGTGDSQEVTLTAVFFEDGARTRPHTHATDQVLAVVEGTCVVANETGRNELDVGEYAHVRAGEWHWHGAAPGTSACHISIRKAGDTDWSVPQRDW